MPAVDEKTRERLIALVRDHHLAFKVEALGPTVIDKADLGRLVRAGLLPENLVTRAAVSVPAAHTVGVLAATAGDDSVEKMSEDAFWEYVKQAPPTLAMHERDAVQAARRAIGRLVDSYGDQVVGELERALHDEDAKLRREAVVVKAEPPKSKSRAEVAGRVKRKMSQLQRDWRMAAHTELHNITEEGKANAILSNRSYGPDPRVFKRTRPDACKFCKLLYTVDGVRPRVFRLSELSGNGSNHGRKAKRPTLRGANATEWRAVLGVVHPWCQCTLFVLPDGFSFDAKGNMVFKKSLHDEVDDFTPELRELAEHVCESE